MIFRWVLNPWAWSNTGLIINKFYSKYEIFVHMHHISVQILYMKLDEMNWEQIKYISTDRFSVDQTQRNNANLNKEIFITVWEYGLILKQRKKLSYYFNSILEKHTVSWECIKIFFPNKIHPNFFLFFRHKLNQSTFNKHSNFAN